MYRQANNGPYAVERIVSALSYLTAGMVGFVWLIISMVAGVRLTKFVKYHVFQSIFLSIGWVLLSMLIGFVVQVLTLIPLINKLTAQIIFLLNMPLLFNYSLIQTLVYTVVIYLTLTSAMGQFSRLPYVSKIIDYNVR